MAFIAKPIVVICPQGEPKSFCKDAWLLEYGKIAIVPKVNPDYSNEASKEMESVKGYVSDF